MKGVDGEERALKYLKGMGYKIIDRNYKTRFGEIDIIAEKEGVIVFIEVKSRSSDWAEEAFTTYKAKKVYRTAMIYLSKEGLLEREIRFDLIAINGDVIEHYENVLVEGGEIG